MVEKLKHFDYLLFGSMIALIGLGTMSIWSAGNARTEVVFHGMWLNNLLTALVGLVLYFVLAFFDYRKYLGLMAWPAYALAFICLIAVLVFGDTVFGGRRWLWFFQPSEMAKLCVLALLAEMLGSKMYGWLPIESFRCFLVAAVVVVIPAVLILAEPDLGTTLVLVPAAVVLLLAARVWRRGLVTLIAIGGILTLSVLGAVYEAEKPGVSPERRERILRFVPLKEHQVKRVKTFLFPASDDLGSGWNLRQSKISIGSGGLTGKGLGKGETNHLKYLPQAISMNDFIFCVYAEEMGFVGTVVLLTLFGVLLLSSCRVAYVTGNASGRLLALGIAMLVFGHVYINLGMSIGLVPITGLPLPFVSSGRTFLITAMCGFGLIQSISIHKEINSQ